MTIFIESSKTDKDRAFQGNSPPPPRQLPPGQLPPAYCPQDDSPRRQQHPGQLPPEANFPPPPQ